MNRDVLVKRRHHYVWAHYLRSWADGDELYYVSPKGKIARSDANGLASESGFYKINYLADEDVKYLSKWIEKSEPGLKELHEDFLNDFILRAGLVKMCSEITHSDKLNKARAGLEFNSLEDVYTRFEQSALNVLNRLVSGGFSVLKLDENVLDFCCYLGHQLTRTKAFRERTLTAIRENSKGSSELEYFSVMAEKNWWYVSFIFGLNSGWSFYSTRKSTNMVFLTNKTEQPFITSDNPVVNVHSCIAKLEEGEAPEFMDLYFPISPKFAVMINDSKDYNHLSYVSELDVNMFNGHIAGNAHSSVYGNRSDTLKELKWKPKAY